MLIQLKSLTLLLQNFNSLRSVIKKIAYPFLKRWYSWYYRKPRKYSAHGIDIVVQPGVFHPGMFLSTNILIDFLTKRELAKKKVLELGAGSGMISFFLAQQKDALVTASDINPTAIKGLIQNNKNREKAITIVQSDLFEFLNPNDYSLLVINPPYYPQNPSSDEEYAFYCGENFNYFHRLFEQLSEKWTQADDEIIIILSEDCAIEEIQKISKRYGFKMMEIYRCKKRQEWNYLFNLERDE